MLHRILFMVFFTAALIGCKELGRHFSEKSQSIEVDYYLQQCEKTSSNLCFRSREKSSDSFKVITTLGNFSNFQWGTRYSIEVSTTFNDQGEVSSYQYRSINSESIQGDAFSLTLYTASNILQPADDTRWILAADKTFSCTAEQCSAIKNAVDSQQVIQLEFTAVNNELTLNNVLCQSAENNFASTCQGVTDESWHIAFFQSDCNNAVQQKMCLVYRKSNSDNWELLRTLTGNISDFTPQWGEEYTIEVTQTVTNGGDLTAASLKTTDASPATKTGTGNNFKFVVQAGYLSSLASGASSITLYDTASTPLVCNSVCATIDSARSNERMLLLDAYVDNGEVIVNQILCNESRDNFNQCVKDNHDDVHWWPWKQ